MAAAPSARADWAFSDGPRDPLAAALAACLHAGGREVDETALIAGLPLPRDGRMTPELALRAAEAQGQRARIARRRLTDMSEALLPAVLFLRGRDACVLLERTPDNALEVHWPSRSDERLLVDEHELGTQYAGHALVMREDTALATDPSAAQTLGGRGHWYWAEARRHWPDYTQVIVASCVINLLALAIPIFTMNVYDRVFPNASLITLWSLVAGVGVALVFDGLLKWVRASLVDSVGRRVDLSVSSRIFAHMADLRLQARNQSSGALMNALKDYEQVRDFFSSQTVATLTDLVFAVLFIGVIVYIGGPLGLPPAVALALVLLYGLALLVPLRRATNAARATSGTKNSVAVEALTNSETLKAVAGQGRMQGRWETQVAESAQALERSRKLANSATIITALATQMSSVAIVVIGVYLALEGQITMGAVIAAMILSGRAMAPTGALSGLFVRGSFAFSTLKSLNEIMAIPTDARARGRTVNARAEAGRITFKSVSLIYPGAVTAAINETSLSVAGQERLGIIGAVGSGKTTLARLAAGLYAPSTGMVLLDDLNLEQLGPAGLRRDIQMVPQEAVLFSGTLAENIAFGMPQARDDEILWAARVAGVDHIAAAHPEGFAMAVDENGRNLSGGQRQMVALARALLARPKVLVLDEPTSSMDMQAERLFIARLAAALEQRPTTLIVATHRMGLLDLVDRVVLLRDGAKFMDGPKADILAALEQPPKGPRP